MRFATMVAQASTRMPENLKEALRLAALANGDSMSAERECRYQIRRLGRRR
jgi:hypothetical protein